MIIAGDVNTPPSVTDFPGQGFPGTGKGQFSFQSQRKAMQKNAQTTAKLHSSHTLVK